MSKIAAIDVAVRQELARQAPAVAFNYNTALGGAAGYGLNDSTLELLLVNVANRLMLDTPRLRFDWQRIDIGSRLNASLWSLLARIEHATDILPELAPPASAGQG